jgi:hypothetical protein
MPDRTGQVFRERTLLSDSHDDGRVCAVTRPLRRWSWKSRRCIAALAERFGRGRRYAKIRLSYRSRTTM